MSKSKRRYKLYTKYNKNHKEFEKYSDLLNGYLMLFAIMIFISILLIGFDNRIFRIIIMAEYIVSFIISHVIRKKFLKADNYYDFFQRNLIVVLVSFVMYLFITYLKDVFIIYSVSKIKIFLIVIILIASIIVFINRKKLLEDKTKIIIGTFTTAIIISLIVERLLFSLNCSVDIKEVNAIEVEVNNKYNSSGKFNNYYICFDNNNTNLKSDVIQVKLKDYRKITVNSKIELNKHKGLLGIEWYDI